MIRVVVESVPLGVAHGAALFTGNAELVAADALRTALVDRIVGNGAVPCRKKTGYQPLCLLHHLRR